MSIRYHCARHHGSDRSFVVSDPAIYWARVERERIAAAKEKRLRAEEERLYLERNTEARYSLSGNPNYKLPVYDFNKRPKMTVNPKRPLIEKYFRSESFWDSKTEITIISSHTTEKNIKDGSPGDREIWEGYWGRGVVYHSIDSVEKVVLALEDQVKRTGYLLNRVNISGHGYNGGVVLVKDEVHFSADSITSAQVKRIKNTLHKNSYIILWVCGSAEGNGYKKSQELANLLGVKVTAKIDDCSSGANGLRSSGFEWLGNQIVFRSVGLTPPEFSWKTFYPEKGF